MPRIKLDYVVSFSSEDSDNKADSLLNWDVSKKKWLCCRGESSSSVVLQLKSCTQISSVTIGVYHAALVEVLVGLSEKPNNPYEVLVPSSIFVNPIESRKSDNIERVRSFTTDQLCEGVRSKRWDRLRVVCSQPYNKHCQYGLSFVHIFSPDDTSPAPAPVTASDPITLPTYSSDEDEFKPGELFALHRQSQGESSNTDAQIRQASSQAIKNISDTATKLVKTPITKPNTKTQAHKDENPSKDRQRNNLIYTEDDAEPHAKIDRIVQRHNDEKNASKSKENETKDKKRERHKTDDSRLDSSVTDSKTNKNKQDKKERDSKTDTRRSDKDEIQSNSSEKVKNTPSTSRDVASTSKNKDGEKNNLKRTYADRKDVNTDLIPGPKSSSPHTLFKNVVFAISGYENPRRANIRSTALAMGASYKQNWTPECTHLICAFSNTPKLKTVRSHPEGHRCTVVTGEWVEECSAHMRLLPWQWYATEQSKKVERKWTGDEEEERSGNNEDMDTDDEIERVVQQQKRRKTDQNVNRTSDKKIIDNNVKQNDNIQDDVMENDNIQDDVMQNDNLQDDFKNNETDIEDIKNKSSDSDVAFVRDERIQGNITIQDSDIESDTPTDIEEGTTPNRPTQLDHSKALPDLFQGMTFHLSPNMTAEDKVLIERYLTAYGGVVIENSVDEEQAADYTICTDVEDYTETDTAQNSRQCVRADWVWQCHEQKTRCGVEEFLLEGREVK